jgi:hypothetical protein
LIDITNGCYGQGDAGLKQTPIVASLLVLFRLGTQYAK